MCHPLTCESVYLLSPPIATTEHERKSFFNRKKLRHRRLACFSEVVDTKQETQDCGQAGPKSPPGAPALLCLPGVLRASTQTPKPEAQRRRPPRCTLPSFARRAHSGPVFSPLAAQGLWRPPWKARQCLFFF